MSNIKFFSCSRMGHFARDCTNEHVTFGAVKREAVSMAFSVEDDAADNRREWIVDSGATSHMTGHMDNLTEVRDLEEPRTLTVASGDKLVTAAVGQAPLLRDGDEVCVLQEVLFVRGLARNLVFVAAASKNGMEVVFKDVTCVIRSRSGVTLEASRANQSINVVDAVSETIPGTALMTSEAPPDRKSVV